MGISQIHKNWKTKKAENETKRKQCQHQCWTHIHLHSHIIHALLLGTQRNFKRWHQPLDHGDGNLFHISPKSFAKTAISTNWGKIHNEVCRPAGRQRSTNTWHPLKTLLLWALHSAYYTNFGRPKLITSLLSWGCYLWVKCIKKTRWLKWGSNVKFKTVFHTVIFCKFIVNGMCP